MRQIWGLIMVRGTVRCVAIALIFAAMAMLVAFAVTSQKRLLSGGLFGVLMGGTTLSYLRKAKQDQE